MKFVCDSCNAKYQIGDDKVAGKTLRMKCRRCGHMIQVAATVTESSVSQKPPQDPSVGVHQSALEPFPNGDMGNEDGATVVKPSPLFLLEAGGLGGVPPSTPPPGGIPRPGPSVAGTSQPFRGGPRIVPPARPSMRSSVAPAAPGTPGAATAPRGQSMPGVQSPGTPGVQSMPGTQTQSAPGLYGGFARAVNAPNKAADAPAVPTEDWYVGVNGVPLGPVRLAVLRDKAAQGQVDGESLVWREGFDEWQPAKTFPGLLAMIEEARQTRASRTNLPAVTAPTPHAAAPQPEPSIPFNLVNARGSTTDVAPGGSPDHGGASNGASNNGPSNNGASNNGASNNGGIVVGSGFDPFAPRPAEAAAPGPSQGSSNASGAGTWGEQAAGPVGFGLTTTGASAADTNLEPPKKKGIHPAVWAFVAMAAAFGGVAAWAIFLRKPNVVYVPGETTTVAGQGPGQNVPLPSTGATSTTTAASSAVVEPQVDASGKPVLNSGGGPRPSASISKTGEYVAPIDNGGPTVVGPSTSEPPPSDGPLTSGQISGVVSSNTARVRKRCWDAASSGRSADAPSTVKVTADISIAPSGSVSSVKVSGGNEKYYPGLVSCVQSTISAWKFPTAGESSTVKVPFSFAAQ